MRTLTILLTAAVLFLIASACPAAGSQRIGGVDISQWRGFNLLNEPTRSTREQYLKVFRRVIEAIQKRPPIG